MDAQMRFWLACQPDVQKPIGGVKQLHRLAESLTRLGYEAALIQDDPAFKPGWFESTAKTTNLDSVQTLSKQEAKTDIVIIPETYVECIENYLPGLPKVIFNQNFAYTFNGSRGLLRPDKVQERYLDRNVLATWCVSDYDRSALVHWLGSHGHVCKLVNAIRSDIFTFDSRKEKLIAYMSRKNREHVEVVKAFLFDKLQQRDWKLVEINNLNETQTAGVMQRAAIYLAFGFPEGFGLPLAEALACGCSIIGYSGLGGRELMALASCYGCGDEVEYGDLTGFSRTVVEHMDRFDQERNQWIEDQRRVATEVLQCYSLSAMDYSVSLAVRALRHA